ncbi:XkdQ/YqbQ family protein [Jeotgalibaca porci]|uniref:XkdQ/YqbQ family protein n=1 Tax=Jeotgalibaca porci TaxID=1868793 RepID=UPI0035A1C158
MKYEIAFQDNLTGEVWDLSPVVIKFSLASDRNGQPSKLEVELISALKFPEGSPVTLKVMDPTYSKNLFYGYLFKVITKGNNRVTLTFYDQRIYLKRTGSYVFTNQTLPAIVSAVAKDFELKVGKLNAPNIKLPTILKEDKSALDIIQECMDQLLAQTGEYVVFWDEYGELRLEYPEKLRLLNILGPGSIVSNFEHARGIEDSANTVKLSHDHDGQRTNYVFKDSNNVKKWGKLEYFTRVDEKLNAAQIKSMGEKLLKLRNKPKETLKIYLDVGNFDFESGRAVFVELPDVKVKGWFLIEKVTHQVNPASHTMDVELWMGDIPS